MNLLIKLMNIFFYCILITNSTEINVVQQCFINFLKLEKLSESCSKIGIFSNYPRSLYLESDVTRIYSKKSVTEKFFTSVWCSSSDISGLRCNFKNLCFLPERKLFIFISSSSSIVYGVKSIYEMVNILFSSSVNYHNAFQVPLAVVNRSSYLNMPMNYVEENVIFLSRFKPDNLQHVFHDDLLPLYFTLQELSPKTVSIIIDNLGKLDHDYLYKAVAKNLYFISDFPSELLCFLQSNIGLNKMSTFYDYNFLHNSTSKSIYRHINKFHLQLFVHEFSKAFQLSYDKTIQKKNKLKIVVIDRKMNRKILNIVDLKINLYDHISLKYNDFSLHVLSIESDGVIHIIKEMLTTDILIGMHGASLILSLFMPPLSSLIELWPYGLDPSIVPVYKSLCEIKEIYYHYWVNKDISNTVLHPEYPSFHGGIKDWSANNYESLLSSLTMKNMQHVTCCDNPEWLLRVYQDTIINVYPFKKLKSVLIQNVIDEILGKNIPKYSDSSLREFIPLNHQFLSQVENISCVKEYEKHSPLIKLTVKWNKPWNKDKIGCRGINYEIILKEIFLDREDVTHFYYTQETIFKKKISSLANLHIWITSLCDQVQGATSFVMCT